MDKSIEAFRSGFTLAEEVEKLGAQPTKEAKRTFFNVLRRASYLVPCKPDDRKELSVVRSQEGDNLLPLFTDFAELSKCPFPHEEAVILPYEKLKTLVLDRPEALKGLVLNPFGRSLRLGLDQLREIDSVTTGFSYERTKPQGEVRFFPPFVTIPALNERLAEVFSGFDTVYKAFLLLAQPLTAPAPHLVLVIDFTGERTELFPRVAAALQPFLHKGDRFEITKADYRLLTLAERAAKPIYER